MATTSNLTGSAAAADLHGQYLGPTEGAEQPVTPVAVSARLQRVCGHSLRVAATFLVGYSFAVTAWHDRLGPEDMAIVAATALLLAALLRCLRRVERLTRDTPVRERRRVLMTVWVLSTALCCTFVYTVAALMPHGLAVLVWCMILFVVLVGFYLLVLCIHQQYPVDDFDTNPAIELV